MAAVEQVERLDLTPRQLQVLLSASRSRVWTDLPRSVEAAQELIALAEGARLRPRDAVVFGPSKWAFTDETTPLYAFRPSIGRIRDWMNDRYGTPPKER